MNSVIRTEVLLEMTISRFQSVKRVYELEPGLLRFLMAVCKPFRSLDGKPNAVNCHACLVSHFEFHRRGPRSHLGLHDGEHFTSEFGVAEA